MSLTKKSEIDRLKLQAKLAKLLLPHLPPPTFYDDELPADREQNKKITRHSPIHIIIVADDSGSMGRGPKPTLAQITSLEIKAWFSELKKAITTKGGNQTIAFSFVIFGTDAITLCKWKWIEQVDISQVELVGGSGLSNMAAALDAVRNILKNPPPSMPPVDVWCKPFVFIYSDGKPNHPDNALHIAKTIKEMDSTSESPLLVTIGLGNQVDTNFMQQLATSPDLYKKLANAHDLAELLPKIGSTGVISTSELENAIRSF